MPSSKNIVVVASAGARKTTMVVEEALAVPNQKVLITTYTNENVAQIRDYLTARCGCVPKHIDLLSWYSFLLRDGVKPYQRTIVERGQINSISFAEMPESAKFARKGDVERHYLSPRRDIYRDRVSAFACECDSLSRGLVIRRMEKIYDQIFIDEMQDLAGYDLNFLEKLFRSEMRMTVVGDPRQGTYSTNNSTKNARFKRDGIINFMLELKAEGLVTIEEKTECFRCNQEICDFADALFPTFSRTKSMNMSVTGHDGIFYLKRKEVPHYYKEFRPVVLRWSKTTDTMDLFAINFGMSKGRTFDRVLIFPTAKMKEYLATKDLKKAGDIAKLYVAVTRARYSVAFVIG